MNKSELWKEITILVQATHFTEIDKEILLNLINEYSIKEK